MGFQDSIIVEHL